MCWRPGGCTSTCEAVAELEAAGTEIVLPLQRGGLRSWLHFRAPDGFVYELVEDPSR